MRTIDGGVGSPLIIGSGLSGMTISRVLSDAQITHVLLGGPPDSLPRLGESLNLEGTLGIRELFPDLTEFFYPKKWAVGYMGHYTFSCDLMPARKLLARLVFKCLGYPAPRELLQIDRIGFDAKLFDKTTASAWCELRNAEVADIQYDEASDSIALVELSDGSTLRPSYVFDASNHHRLVAQAANVPCQVMGDPQRVVYTHYTAPSTDSIHAIPDSDWQWATSVVVLRGKGDPIDAVAWCIPLGDYVSIGASMVDGTVDLTDDEILDVVAAAFARRGLPYRERFPSATVTKGLRHQYFAYARSYGSNWLLVGPSYCQVWWLAAAGVGSAFAAASVARQVLEDPQRYGRAYDEYLRHLVPIHKTFEWFAVSDPREVTRDDVQRMSDAFVATNVERLLLSTRIRDSRSAAVFATALRAVYRPGSRVKSYCRVYEADLADQTCVVFATRR